MDKKTRLISAFDQKTVDRVPVGFWFHFTGENMYGEKCIQSHLDYYLNSKVDYAKIMCDGYFRPPMDYGVKNASDWITEQAKISTAQYFAVEQKFDEYSLVLNSDDLSTISQQTEYYWQYLSSLYEDNGISQDSLNLINTNVYKTSLLFDALYGEGGEKEVSDDELKQAYLNDYVKTTFYALSLTDSSGELLSEEDQAAVRERIQNIYDKANAGDDFYDLILEDEKSDLGEDDTVHEHTGVEHDAIIYKEDATSFPEGFYDIIKAINTDSYDMFEIDNYVVVAKRVALDTESEEFENSKTSILSNLKGDEFMELIEQWGNETEVTYNEDA